MKKNKTIYYIGGAIILYLLYTKYWKTPAQTPVITNTLSKESQSTTPQQQTSDQVAPNVELIPKAGGSGGGMQFLSVPALDLMYSPDAGYTGREMIDVKYAISGSKQLRGTPSII